VTFYATVAGSNAHVDLVLALRVEGIPVAFVERTVPSAVASALSGYTQFAGLTRVEEGEAVLDMQQRREMAATLQVDILDDTARTLSALLAVNRRPIAYARTDRTTADTTITFDPTGVAALSTGQVIYSDRETITLGTVTSSPAQATGCTRGAFGSTAVAVYGDTAGSAADGEPFYAVPPNWVGRRAYLYGYTLDAAGGGFEQLLGTWVIDEPPRHRGDDTWSLTMASVAQEYYERTVGFGLRTEAVKPTAGYPLFGTSGGRGTIEFQLHSGGASAFRMGSSYPTYVVASSEDGEKSCIFELSSVNTANDRIVVFGSISESFFGTRLFPFIANFRPLAILPGRRAPLYALRSGDGQAGGYDALPGRATVSLTNPGWRLGAGFSAADVDVTSWEAIETPDLTLIIDDQMPVADLLREWCLLSDTATRIDAQGRLSVFSVSTPRFTSTVTLDASSVVPDSRVEVFADEGSIFPLADVQAGYSPLTREFAVQASLVDTVAIRRYARAPQTLDLELRSIGVSDAPATNLDAPPFVHPSTVPLAMLPTLLANVQRGDGGLARRLIRLSLTLRHLDLRIGDAVTLTGMPEAFSTLPDMQGGTLDGVRARVIARRPRYDDGRVDVHLAILEPLVVVCPACVIASAAGTTLTLSTTDDASTSTPANDFIVGVGVRIFDRSANTSHTTSVSSIPATNQLVIASAPGFAIEAGVDYVVLSPYHGSTSTSTASATGYTLPEMGITIPNVSGSLVAPASGAINNQPRWR
jgi:hypothetical protein